MCLWLPLLDSEIGDDPSAEMLKVMHQKKKPKKPRYPHSGTFPLNNFVASS